MTAAIVISWGATIPGREAAASSLLGRTVEYYQQLEKNKKIASFSMYLFECPTRSGDLGFAVLQGTEDQLDVLRKDNEFRANGFRLSSITADVSFARAETGQAMLHRAQQIQAVRKELGFA